MLTFILSHLGYWGGALGGPNLDLAFVWVFFSPNQKIQKTKYVFIGPINTTALESNPNFDIGTLSPPLLQFFLHFEPRGIVDTLG